MKIRYSFPRLSREEKDLLEAILLEEIDMQRWFTVACSEMMGDELILTLQ